MTSIAFSRRQMLGFVAGAAAAAATGPARAEDLLSPLPGRPKAKNFALENLDGKVRHLSDYRGHVVIVNFWATWCPPCRFEIPSMQRAWKILKPEGIVMLAIHVGGDVDHVMQFAADDNVDFPILWDKDSSVIDQWPVKGLPTTIVVAPDGTMALRAIGSRKWDAPEVLHQIRSLKS